MAEKELLQKLNAQQLAAVTRRWGPCLIVAGAGSGKTTVLTLRIAYLISQLKQDPASILAVTFTNKASGEMKQRLGQLVDIPVTRTLTIGTFHSVAARLLRQEIESYVSPEGFVWRHNFAIYDETDSLSLIKTSVRQLNLDEKVFAAPELRHKISSLKNDGYCHTRFGEEARSYKDIRIAEIFSAYQRELARNNALDFDDLILIFAQLLKQRPDVAGRMRARFRHILVDEFQDTNQSQYELVRLLAGSQGSTLSPEARADAWHERTLMVVGDVDQSIYSWRKADFRIILGFKNDFQESDLIKLEENYRSTSTILQVANDIISNNKERIEKVLRCNRGQGSKIRCYEAVDENDEAYYVVQALQKLSLSGKSLTDSVVLYRTNAQSRVIEELLVRHNIPYAMVGSTRFYDRQEIKDALAYLKLIYNNHDSQSYLRIVNVPRRGLGATTIDRLQLFVNKEQTSILEASRQSEKISGVSARATKALTAFATMISRWQLLAGTVSVSALIELVLSETGYLEKLNQEATQLNDPTAASRIENLQELVCVAREFESLADEPTLEGFLTRVSLVSDLDSLNTDQDAVKLMTLHSAKGLEFSCVFVTGLEEGLLPHVRSLNSPSALEEERRLMYVGVTRAADELCLTYARRRRLFFGSSNITNYTVPSRFLSEISTDLLSGYGQTPALMPGFVEEFRGGGNPRRTDLKESVTKSTYRTAEHVELNSRWQEPIEAKQDAFERLSLGDLVQHTKFGVGIVVQIIGQKDKELYTVEFQESGKRLLDPRFAKLVKLNSS